MLLRLLTAVCLGLGATGCLIHTIAPSERLRDAVVGLNDEARWSRLDLARERVMPGYRREWVRSRHDWGRNIQIGDVELLDVRLAEDNETAVSVVAVSWYRYDTMTLRRTVLRQEWRSGGREFYLASEAVAGGDPRLLAPPAEPDSETDTPEAEVAGAASGSDA